MKPKYVPIELDRPRNLRATFGAMCRYHELTGKSVFIAKDLETIDENPRHISTLLWVMLQHEDKELTLEQVEEMTDITHTAYYMDVISKALDTEGETTEKGKN